jgi:hypothetical protein
LLSVTSAVAKILSKCDYFYIHRFHGDGADKAAATKSSDNKQRLLDLLQVLEVAVINVAT